MPKIISLLQYCFEQMKLALELHALINNAARMVMAEYEWQTIQLIQQQIEVNFLGPITLTSQLMPNFRKDKSKQSKIKIII